MFQYQISILLAILLFVFYNSLRPQIHKKEFKINEYLKLKLESGRTNIYIKGRIFQQCMYLLLNIPVNRIEDYDEIESIDEAAEKLDRSMEGNHHHPFRSISPEEEFQGHCSNIQAWTENGYDTRILHRNLAFPLLKRLTEVGDPMARKVFSEEIAIRLASKHPTVTQYLTQNGYLKYLSSDEFESIIEDINPNVLNDIINELERLFQQNHDRNIIDSINYIINRLIGNFGIEHISLLTSKILKNIPDNFRKVFVKNVYNILRSRSNFPLIKYINKHFKFFNDFKFEYNFVKYEDRIVGLFKNALIFLNNQNIQKISELDMINGKFEDVKELDLSNNQITDLKGIELFPNIRILKLNSNKLAKIEGNEKLKNLEILYLRNNQIVEIKNLKRFSNLKLIDLSDNPTITQIPESLNDLENLETIRLWNCNVNKFSKSTENFFWMNQNYRFFKGYDENDKEFYESRYRRVASSDNKLYKHFVKWKLKIQDLMNHYNFSYQDIHQFCEETSKNAIWSGTITNDFKKWIDDKKYQKKITFFL
ncbi:MAG: leucine-rich repeat domain-containing protein [Candidatus Odinarchaeota archaeon]